MWSPLTKLPNNSKIAVVGSGVSGLMFTYFLGKLRPDVSISVFESQKRSGGWINSWQTKDQNGEPIMLEKGPRTLRGLSDGTVLIMDTLKDLNQEDIIQFIDKNSEANRKFLLGTNNKLVQVPSSILSFAKFVVNPLSKGLFKGLLGEWFRKSPVNADKDESVNSFISRRFGSEYISKNLLSAIFHGIYADDVNQLSARRTLRDLYVLEKDHGSIFKGAWAEKDKKKGDNTFSECLAQYQEVFGKKKSDLINLSNNLKRYPMLGLKGGLEAFPKSVRKAIDTLPNVKVIVGEEVVNVSYDRSKDSVSIDMSSGETVSGLDHVRLTTNPTKMSQLVKTANQKLSEELKVVKSNTVLLVNYFLPGKDVIERQYHGFGYLVPKSNKNPQRLLGVIFDSIIEKNFKPFAATDLQKSHSTQEYTKLTIMLGGHFLNHKGQQEPLHKEAVIREVKEVLNSQLSITKEDLDRGLWQYTVAEKCLPHFFVGYDEWQAAVEEEFLDTYTGKVSVGGMGFSRGPGVPDVIVDALQDAVKLR